MAENLNPMRFGLAAAILGGLWGLLIAFGSFYGSLWPMHAKLLMEHSFGIGSTSAFGIASALLLGIICGFIAGYVFAWLYNVLGNWIK